MASLTVKAAATGGGDGTVGDPYTLQEAFDNVAAGDDVTVWADASYSITVQIDIDTTAGTAAAPILIKGANSSGTVDGTRPHIQATSSISRIFNLSPTFANYYHYTDLDLDANSLSGRCIQGTSAATSGSVYERLTIRNATSAGFQVRTPGNLLKSCSIHGNFKGIQTTNTDLPTIVDCDINDNTSDGIHSQNNGHVFLIYGCRIFSNGTGITLTIGNNRSCNIVNNTFYDNVNGINLTTDLVPGAVIANNSFYNNTGFGIDTNANEINIAFIDHNHYEGNTSGESDITTPGSNNISGDPLFTDVGNDDFTPTSSSPLIAAGFVSQTIGAIGAAGGSGGGGGGRRTRANIYIG